MIKLLSPGARLGAACLDPSSSLELRFYFTDLPTYPCWGEMAELSEQT